MGLFHHVFVYMGDLYFVHHSLNLSILEASILIMVQQVSLMMFSLDIVDYRMSFFLLSTRNFGCQLAGQVDHSRGPF